MVQAASTASSLGNPPPPRPRTPGGAQAWSVSPSASPDLVRS